MSVPQAKRRFWRRNITLVIVLLSIWFTVSCVCSILLAPWLNRFQFAGFPLGFWFAQQGSILVFIVLILVYALVMRRLDRDLADAEKREEDAQ